MACAMRAAGAILGLLLSMCASLLLIEGFGGTSIAIEADALDPGTHLEERQGELDYCYSNLTEIWKEDWTDGPLSTITTSLGCVDIDGDGVEEVTFGTYDGRIVVLDPLAREVLLDMSVAEENVESIDVGNLDEDPGMELVCIAYDGSISLVCVDFTSQEVQWRLTNPVVPEQVSLFDDDADGVSDILVTGGSRYWRIDGHGDVGYNRSLDLFSGPVSTMSSHLIGDLDGDGDLEALFVDKHAHWGPPEYQRVGRHLWMIALGTGEVVLARSFPELVFESDPMLLQSGELGAVLVGLNCDPYDLWALDLASGNSTLHDLSDGSLGEDYWSQLAMTPGEDGPVVLMSSDTNARLAWSVRNGTVLWSTAKDSRQTYMSHITVCDIDGDGEQELISPFGTVTVLDAQKGTLEADLGVVGKMAIGDLDGDGLSELCLDVWDYSPHFRSEAISVLDSPIYIEWTAGTMNGTATLYAAIEGELELMVRGMMRDKVPPRMSLHLGNQDWGDFLMVELDLLNGTLGYIHNDMLRVLSFDVEPTERALLMSLRMLPSWAFSYGGTNEVRLAFDDRRGLSHVCNVTDAFTVERDLVIVGRLDMSRGEKPLPAGSWVRPDVGVHVQGFDVVYEGTSDLRPTRAAFRIIEQVGWRRAEHFCHNAERLEIDFKLPWYEGLLSISLGVNQTLAGVIGKNCLNTTLLVDGWRPLLLEPEGLDRWHKDIPIEVTVYFDEPDSGMDETCVRYAAVKARWDEPTREYEVSPEEFGRADDSMQGRATHWAELHIYATEGAGYLLIDVWDKVGNSARYTFLVRTDRTPPSILFDTPDRWLTGERIALQIEVTDIDGSGVDPRTVLCSSSYEESPPSSAWRSMHVEGEGERVSAYMQYDGVQGSANYIWFKAWDVMDHETLVGPFNLKLDSVAPEAWVEGIEDGEVIDPPLTELRFRVHIVEDGSGLDEVEPSIVDAVTNESMVSDFFIEVLADDHYVVTVQWHRVRSDHYVLSFRCTDVAGNAFETAPVRVLLNDPPRVMVSSPEDGALLDAGREVIFRVDIEDTNSPEACITCSWDIDGRPWVMGVRWFSNSTLPSGTYTVTVKVSDGYHTVRDSISITVVEPAQPPGEGEEVPAEPWHGQAIDAIAVIVLLAALVAILAFRWLNRR